MLAGVWIVMMPYLLSPWARFIGGAAAALIFVAALAGLHAHGIRQGRAEVQQKWDAAKAKTQAQAARDEAMAERIVAETSAALSARLAAIKIEHTTINRTIENEIREVPVYRECVVTDSVWNNLNRLRAATRAGPAAGDAAAMPGIGADWRQEHGRAGAGG